MLKNPTIKRILSAVAVAVFGFILLNLTFLFDFLFQSLVDGLVAFLTPVNSNMVWRWFPPIKHALFVAMICLISWVVFRSNLRVLYKAIYMTVPLAVVFVTIGIFLYHWPILAQLLGSVFGIGVFYYLYRTKQHWLYYYTLMLISLTMLLASLLKVEI